ncbi:MAG: Gfo/Idh/MocA family protein [Micrococcales bacterium]
MSQLRWGYLSASNISREMARDFSLAGLKIQAVGARDIAKANAYADEFDIPNRHGSYEALVNDPEVDIVYVSTLQTLHFEHTMLAVNAGKHVLCEKPFTINANQAEQIQQAAKAKGVMVMEAMWTRFLPNHVELYKDIESGSIGEVTLVSADHSQALRHAARLWDPASGGGALLDLGIYPVSFANRILGAPSKIIAQAKLTDQNLDEITTGLFDYQSGAKAAFTTSMATAGPVTAFVLGTTGRIEIVGSFYSHVEYRIFDNSGKLLKHYVPNLVGRGMQHQAIHFEDCIKQGLLDSPELPIAESVQIMQVLDEIRRQTGVVYPGE